MRSNTIGGGLKLLRTLNFFKQLVLQLFTPQYDRFMKSGGPQHDTPFSNDRPSPHGGRLIICIPTYMLRWTTMHATMHVSMLAM